MIEMWNERYSSEDYVYGTKPNAYFKQIMDTLKPGRLLLPAEGEGRNAVYAALQGWQVEAFDQSTEGKRKAELLAKQNGVNFQYHISDFNNVNFDTKSFDCLALIYAHMQPEQRINNYKKAIKWLKPDGALILEGFSKQQIDYNSGGSRNVEMLFSENELKHDFAELKIQEINTCLIELSEGNFHMGQASVVRLYAIK